MELRMVNLEHGTQEQLILLLCTYKYVPNFDENLARMMKQTSSCMVIKSFYIIRFIPSTPLVFSCCMIIKSLYIIHFITSTPLVCTISNSLNGLWIYGSCDRIIWIGDELKQILYSRNESKFCDHWLVKAIFSTEVKVSR